MGKLEIICGNIVSDEILTLGEAVVLPTNPMMRCGAGVSGAIFKKAGVDALEQYCEKAFGISYFNEPGVNEMTVTEVRITPGFRISAKIIFAQGPKKWEYDNFEIALYFLIKTYENVLIKSVENKFKSILIPALGTGDYGFSHEETAEPVLALLNEFANAYDLNLFFVTFESETKALYDDVFQKLICNKQ